MSNYSFSCFINVSNFSLTDFAWTTDYPRDPDYDSTGNGHAISAVVIIFFLLAVPWNLLVIGGIIKKKLYTQPVIMLMLNLALTNLLVALLVMPFHMVSGIKGEYAFGETDLIRCRVCQTGVIVILLPWVSAHTLALMAVDRFIYLKQPLKYATIVTPLRTSIALVIVWVLCLTLSLPPLFGFGEIKFSYTVANCVPYVVGSTPVAPNYYYVMLMTAEAIVPILTLFVLYVWIVYIIKSSLTRSVRRSMSLRSKSTRRQENTNHTSQSNSQRGNQLRLVGLFGAIFTANIITWLPMVGLTITGAVLGTGRIPTLPFTVAYLSYLSETVIHPMLQVCLIRDIKMMLLVYFAAFRGKLLKCRCYFKEDLRQVEKRKPSVQKEEGNSSSTVASDVTIVQA